MPNLKHGEAIVEDVLKHYGVKGMKWGVKRPVGSNGRVKKGKVSVKDMSNDDLREIIQRAELTSRYNKINKSPARREVEKILTDVGRTQATRLANKYAAEGLDLAIKGLTEKRK